jgi:hypothetical protein
MSPRNRKKLTPEPVEYRDGLPVFAVRREGPNFVFQCPECKATIRHGCGENGNAYGHRLSHCECWKPGGYFLAPATPPRLVPPGAHRLDAPSGDPTKIHSGRLNAKGTQ